MDIDNILTRGVSEILPDKDSLKKLLENKKITIYQGFDPTGDSLHIGHFIGLRKLSKLQKLGHKVIFLIGDFTAMIGDPTDKSATRKKLTREEVENNFKNYREQASKVLDFEGENAAIVKYNSEWLAKLTFEETLNLSANFTVQQMIERNMFKVRLNDNKPIYLHEFLYPMMQGYDSVAMEVDMEIGGNDQLFNMMAGRTLLKTLKDREKFVLTMKLLEDGSGWKMGKTEGNAVNLSDTAENIYGKVMAFPDSMLSIGYELLTDIETIDQNPMNAKKALAFDLVRQIKGEENAQKAQSHFENNFQKGETEYTLFDKRESFVSTIAVATGESNSGAKRLITQNAVTVNGEKVNSFEYELKSGDKLRIGTTNFIEIKDSL